MNSFTQTVCLQIMGMFRGNMVMIDPVVDRIWLCDGQSSGVRVPEILTAAVALFVVWL